MMDDWIKITDDNLPEFGKPVIVRWSKSPFHTDRRPYALHNVLERIGEGHIWWWADSVSEEIIDWSECEEPTHYQPWPEPPE